MTDLLQKRVYSFGNGIAEGSAAMKNLLGGKGAGLAEMTRIGIPVPPGFTITTECCIEYQKVGKRISDDLWNSVKAAVEGVEAVIGSQFGNRANPLLVSVRSGARASMPGMMDTILNVGLNDETVAGLSALSGDARFVLDSYRRLIQMYGDVVLGVHDFYFEETLNAAKARVGVENDSELPASSLELLVHEFKDIVAKKGSAPFPQDPWTQLRGAIVAVFDSWDNDRAAHYREINNIPYEWGTAVNVQAMVFGNRGDNCATGVAFTRNPATGEKSFYGEFLPNAQGEDVVAGIRTPQPISGHGGPLASLQETMPDAFAELIRLEEILERHYRDMQDIEFTIENGRVWILQTRNGKRTTTAAVRTAVEMAREGLITIEEAILRVEPSALDDLLHPCIDPAAELDVLAIGLAASPGAATGQIVLTAEDAEKWARDGKDVILVRTETTPEDIRGMSAAKGILTARGGITSHAAVVARQMGKCCVSGCNEVKIQLAEKVLTIGGRSFREGDVITLEGSRGLVVAGAVPRTDAELDQYFDQLMTWADQTRTLGVRANADNGPDAALARRFGANGIGLTRTEHMFFDGERINSMREMILSETQEARELALEKLRPFQQADFEAIFRAMSGFPVTIRLLDPPLHEFLPERATDISDLASRLGSTERAIHQSIERLRESNPMLGHRGCRLGLTFPEIYDMQARAIFDAALAVMADGIVIEPQVMIPLVSDANELKSTRQRIEMVRKSYGALASKLKSVKIGTMIELPRACVTADAIAAHADFLSFGTNDLTQTTFGFSRDDIGTFLPMYLKSGLLQSDPFATIDTVGVGELIEIACERARRVNPNISIGICGEHGGDPKSIAWAQGTLVDYVSCSPYRVPIARLAAARAAVSSSNRQN